MLNGERVMNTQCDKCPLKGKPLIEGTGAVPARYLLVGEAGGYHEEQTGVPFVGVSGERLNELLRLAGIDLGECYLTNVVKCRPSSKNNTPTKRMVEACRGWLEEEIRMVQPEVIITLGGSALKWFSDRKLSEVHGMILEVMDG